MGPMTNAWQPVLEGDLRERALDAARHIGRALVEVFERDSAPPSHGDASLSRGWTGTAVA